MAPWVVLLVVVLALCVLLPRLAGGWTGKPRARSGGWTGDSGSGGWFGGDSGGSDSGGGDSGGGGGDGGGGGGCD